MIDPKNPVERAHALRVTSGQAAVKMLDVWDEQIVELLVEDFGPALRRLIDTLKEHDLSSRTQISLLFGILLAGVLEEEA